MRPPNLPADILDFRRTVCPVAFGVDQPPESVLRAFGVSETDAVVRAEGGRSTAWLCGSMVLKRADLSEAELSWQTSARRDLPTDKFRVAVPLAAINGSFVVDGWSTTARLAGTHQAGRWIELAASAREDPDGDPPDGRGAPRSLRPPDRHRRLRLSAGYPVAARAGVELSLRGHSGPAEGH